MTDTELQLHGSANHIWKKIIQNEALVESSFDLKFDIMIYCWKEWKTVKSLGEPNFPAITYCSCLQLYKNSILIFGFKWWRTGPYSLYHRSVSDSKMSVGPGVPGPWPNFQGWQKLCLSRRLHRFRIPALNKLKGTIRRVAFRMGYMDARRESSSYQCTQGKSQ